MDLLETWFESIRNGNLKEISAIYKSNPDYINKFTTINDGRNCYQTNAIIEASFQGNRDLVKWLIDNNADVNSTSDGGWRPIHFAAQHGHVTTVNLLVLGGAEVNVETDAKETPILFALQAYMRDTVKKLLHHGASLVGIDRDYLQMCIQKDILDPGFLDEANKSYLADSGAYRKIDSNGYDMINRQHHEPEIEEIKPVKIQKTKVISEYDNELKRRRQELLKKMRRSNEPVNALAPLVRKIAQCDHDSERIALVRELLDLVDTQEGIVPQTKFSDQMINLFELCLCDSGCSDELIGLTGRLMMAVLHKNIRRGDAAVVEFWCRIFDKMTNLQIEQYTFQILKMLLGMLESASPGVVSCLTANRDSFLQNWEYFFENLGFPKCLDLSLMILKKIHSHCPDSVVERFHNVIDIMIGWCIHPDTNPVTMAALCERSVDLHECWLADPLNLKKTLSSLQKDIFTHCQILARIHRLDKDRNQVDDLKLKIKFFCFALSCVTAGISKLADVTRVDFQSLDKHRDPKVAVSVATVLTTPFILSIIEKLTDGLLMCSKQIDFDSLLLQANTAILQLLSIATASPEPVGSVFPTVMKYVFGTSIPLQTHLVNDMNYHNRELLGSYLELIGICLTKIYLESATVIQLMSPVNWIHSCIFYGSVVDPWLLEKYLRLVEIVSRSPCVPTFYQILLSDLELALNSLLKSVSGTTSQAVWRLVQTNAFKSKTYEPGQAELVVRYNVSLIVLLHDKLSPDAVGLLVPSVPVLFTRYLLFQDSGPVAAFPTLAVFVMDTVARQLDVARPDFQLAEFVRYLCLVIGSAEVDFEARQRGFRILLTAIEESPHHSKWVAMTTDIRMELANSMIVALIELIGHHWSADSETLIIDCLSVTKRLLLPILLVPDRSRITDRNTARLTELCVRLCQHPCHQVRCVSFDIYFELVLTTTSTGPKISPCPDAINRDIKSIQSIASTGRSFKFPTDFSKSIFQWIIESTERQSFVSREFLRLHDLVTTTTAMTTTSTSNHRLAMVHQVIINACWDCVRQKLKFDRNADSRATLLGIENTVRAVLTNGASLRGVADARFRQLMTGFTGKAPEDQALSVNLLLVLLEVLEKLFYNAYEGCCLGFPGVAKTTETFFMTNQQVCVDWFAKMRLFVVALAQYSGQWSTVVWHGLQLIQAHLDRNRALTTEVEDCIVLTAMALSKLGSWESLVGLGRAALDAFGAKFEWVDALVDKTRGRLEQAIGKFEAYLRAHHDPEARAARSASEMRLLTRKQSSSHSSFILVMEELADCHKLLGNVDELEAWKRQLGVWRADPQMPQAAKSTINWDRLKCLTKLSQWNNHDNEDGKQGNDADKDWEAAALRTNEISWKYRSVLDHAEDQLYLSLLERDPDAPDNVPSNSTLLDTEQLVGGLASLQMVCDYPGAFSNPDIILIHERLRLIRSPGRDRHQIDCKLLSQFSPTLPLAVIGFCNALHNTRRGPLEHTFPNQMFLIQWHRKHRNFQQCQSLVSSCFSKFLDRDLAINQSTIATLSSPTQSLGNSASPIVQMQLERELVKLLWHQDRRSDALALLTGSLRDSLLFETSDSALHSAKCRINTKSLLTLFRWLCADKAGGAQLLATESRTSANLQFLIELVEVPWINGLPLVSPQQRAQQKQCAARITDVCSQLLILASKSHDHDTKTDKSFMTLAQWCLTRSRSLDKQGFHAESAIARQLGRSLETDHQLSRDTIDNTMVLLRTNFCPTQLKTEHDWFGDCVEDDRFVEELRDSVMALDPDVTASACNTVLRCWADFIDQHFSLHIAAADAYFSFLKDAPAAPAGLDKNKTTANLRILSLLGKRSRALRRAIVAKIKTSPPSAWTSVIPQLFARLKHPDQPVTECMAELLERLAVSSDNCSNLIIYPTLVGAINEADNPSSPYHDIKKVLVDTNRVLVDQVSLFIKELRRITVLWDELWVSSLGQCYDELNKKVHQLQSEIEKIDDPNQQNVKNKETILKLKYNSIIQPAIFILERTQAATSMVPVTPRECWFSNLFAEEIANTIHQVKCPNDIREFNDAWKKVKDLQDLIVSESNKNHTKIKPKRGKHHFLSLKLAEVSPGLSRITASQIPLPGMIDKQLVSIESDINILPTKTKPKKFRFLASDGRRYNYLYKGLEDLRLDERVMQILEIANTMFGNSSTAGGDHRDTNKYRVTTYPVTPLGTRAGLIQMVEEATSLFSLYKRHQIRNKTASLELHKSRLHKSSHATGPVPAGTASTTDATGVSEEGHPIRPTDIYWQKLRPKLEASKIDLSLDNRDKWPLSILMEVLAELSRETPADLLSKELWLCSINPRNWFKSSINFTRSCAVMSILGHVLGLGDRHLDNLLVNFSTGQIVHIDYNVCFDKGLSLKVPEKVPFRLTDIITNVFGPASVNGLFRISCEQVYELIGQCQDSILTLMDTFVFDPIVDWASGTESGHYGSFDGGRYATSTHSSVVDKRSVEFTIQLNQFQSVLVAMESECRVGRDKILEQFEELHSSLASSHKVAVTVESTRRQFDKKRRIIDYLNGYQGEDIVERIRSVKKLESRANHLDVDIANRSKQLKSVALEHSGFFNRILATSDFITIKVDMNTIRQFFEEHLATVDKCSLLLSDRYPPDTKATYLGLVARLSETMETVVKLQDCVQVLTKYRAVVQEMPQSYFTSDRCSFMAEICDRLVREHPNVDNLSVELARYRKQWACDPDVSDSSEHPNIAVESPPFLVEKINWSALLKLETERVQELSSRIPGQQTPHDEEIQELENIWQLTMFENVAGMNLFKAALLEQYLEMAQVAAQLDATVVTKIPDPITLSCDYNATLRKYLQLVNAHENYFKILANSMSMFGIYVNTGEVMIVCQMMSSLQKCCMQALTFESNFIDIILPESMKIVRQLSGEDIALLEELRALVRQGDQVMLHFNIATTSAAYDAKHYEHIHHSVVVPLKERLAQLTSLASVSASSLSTTSSNSGTRQLRILLASFSATILHTHQLACDFIDCCMSSSTPSSWNFIDLVAASSVAISPIWNKSIQLLKDALFVSGLRCIVNTLDHHAEFLRVLDTAPSTANVAPAVDNLLRHLEVYFNFIGRHVIAGVASQCFGKMFCVLLEHAGWNIDTLITDSNNAPLQPGGAGAVPVAPGGAGSTGGLAGIVGAPVATHSPALLHAEFICNSVLSFRKTEYGNAPHFYGQLQYRFTRYRSLAGVGLTGSVSTDNSSISGSAVGDSLRFLMRNLGFHKALSALARNQLISRCWTNRHLLQQHHHDNGGDNDDPDLAPVIELSRLIEGIPERLTMLRALQLDIESISAKLIAIDEEMTATTSSVAQDGVTTSTSTDTGGKSMAPAGSTIIAADRAQSIAALRKRVALVVDILLNIDRFESFRSSSVRAAQFDSEVVELLSNSRELLQTLAESGGTLVPIETDVVRLAEQHTIADESDWSSRLLTILKAEVSSTETDLLEKDRLMREIMVSIDRDGRQLKSRLGTEYYSLLSAVKPSLRVLHSVARKLKTHLSALLPLTTVASNDVQVTNNDNSISIRTRIDQVLALMGLMDKFNVSVDGLVKFMVTAPDQGTSVSTPPPEYVSQLEAQLTVVTVLKDSVISELFETLASLSPLATSDNESEHQQIQSSCVLSRSLSPQQQIPPTTSTVSLDSSSPPSSSSSVRLSTNKVPETANTNGDGASEVGRIGEDMDATLIPPNNSTAIINSCAVTTGTLGGAMRPTAPPKTPRRPLDTASILATATNKIPLTITETTKKQQSVTTTTTVTNGNIPANNAGVQRAIEVWKLIESRLSNATAGGVESSTSSVMTTAPAGPSDDDVDSKTSTATTIATVSSGLSQYVDKLIKAARSPENLARMYEGWTAWV